MYCKYFLCVTLYKVNLPISITLTFSHPFAKGERVLCEYERMRKKQSDYFLTFWSDFCMPTTKEVYQLVG